MMIFAGNFVIPVSRLISISFLESQISINYDGGGLLEVEGVMYPRIETILIHCDSLDECNKLKRQFYKACAEDKKVFYFG